jgi:aminoglycoside 3-N-acetyltransferase
VIIIHEYSPVGAVYRLDGDVLLLGVDHSSNTSLHLAEYRLPDPPRRWVGSAVRTPGGQAWTRWQDVDTDEGDFDQLGAAFEATGGTRRGPVGAAECRLMRQRTLVDFAMDWLTAHRTPAR